MEAYRAHLARFQGEEMNQAPGFMIGPTNRLKNFLRKCRRLKHFHMGISADIS